MKKVIKITIIVVLAIGIAAGVFVGVKLSKDWPDEVVYADTKFYTDAGVYYVKNYTGLVFYDYSTNTESYVCAKPDCEHNDSSCNAYYNALISSIMVYNGKLYVAYSPLGRTEDIDEDAGIQKLDMSSYIEVSELDGSNRKTIYTSNKGTILSMCAIGDELYFTEYQFHDTDNHYINTYYHYSYLFCYDLTWEKTKELVCYEASDESYNSSLNILCYDEDTSDLYLSFDYSDITDEENEKIYSEIIAYDDDGVRTIVEFPENAYFRTESVLSEENGMFCSYAEDYYTKPDDAVYNFVLMDMEGNVLKEMATYTGECSIYKYGSWYMILRDDVNKVMYDTENDKWYVGNNIEESWIPDIVYVNSEQDIVFYDKTDYTGMEPGTILTEDPTSYTSGNWSEFLAEYFTEYDGEAFDWITIN